MKPSKIVFSVIFFVVGIHYVNSQTSNQLKIDSLHNKLSNSELIKKYHTQAELDSLRSQNPKGLLKIEVQYFYSYQIDTINANAYDPEIKDALDRFIRNFDINKYSKKRRPDQRVELNFEKYGIRLTLYRDDELPVIMQQIIDENN